MLKNKEEENVKSANGWLEFFQGFSPVSGPGGLEGRVGERVTRFGTRTRILRRCVSRRGWAICRCWRRGTVGKSPCASVCISAAGRLQTCEATGPASFCWSSLELWHLDSPLWATVWRCSPRKWNVLSPRRRSCSFPVWGLHRPARTTCSPRCTPSAGTRGTRFDRLDFSWVCRTSGTRDASLLLRVWCKLHSLV